MSNQIFDPNAEYVQRFVKNQSKRVKFPSFKYLDVRLHPKYKDHILVLSKNSFPKDVEMTYAHSNVIYDLNNMHDEENKKEFFQEAVEKFEKINEEKNTKDGKKPSQTKKDNWVKKEEKEDKKTEEPKSPIVDSANKILEESKQLGLNMGTDSEEESSSDSAEYEGGNSDKDSEEESKSESSKKSEESKKPEKSSKKDKKKDKKEAKKEKAKEDMEDQMDKVLKEEAKSAEVESDEDVVAAANELIGDVDSDRAKSAGEEQDPAERNDETEDKESSEQDSAKPVKKDIKEEEKETPKGKGKDTKSEDEGENTDQKEDHMTSIPKEEESNNAEENKDEEDNAAEEEKEPAEVTLADRFDKLTKEQQQEVVNMTMDQYYTKVEHEAFWNYHGYAPDPDRDQNQPTYDKLNIPDYTIKAEEKINTEDVSYAPSCYNSWNVKKKYKNIEYKPKILRHKLQMSLWRADHFGVAKTKFNYFTPKSEKFDLTKTFKILPSLDKETIVIKQEPGFYDKEYLVIILDSYNLQVLHEHLIQMEDEEMEEVPGTDDYYDAYYDDAYSKFPTSKERLIFANWNKGRYLAYGITRPKLKSEYYIRIYDLQEDKEMNRVLRDDGLKDRFVYDIKVDPDNINCLYLANWGYSQTMTVCTMDINSGSIKTVSTHDARSEYPGFVLLNDSCTKVFTNTYAYVGSQRLMKIYQLGFNEKATFDSQPSKDPNDMVDSSGFSVVNGNNYVVAYTNERNNFSGKVMGSVNFDRASQKGGMVQHSEVKDVGLMSNSTIIALTKMQDDSFEVNIFPSDERICRNHVVKEITTMKFHYPTIAMVKGGKEILLYNITENLYYYIKLGAPYIKDCLSAITVYGCELRGLLDFGDYYAHCSMSLTTGANSYMSATAYTKYFKKSTFPDFKFYGHFDVVKSKLPAKDEDAYVLQFSKKLLVVASCSGGVQFEVESDYNLGEIISFANDCALFWNKGEKSIVVKTNPINWSDSSSTKSLYESQDYLKSVQWEYDNEAYTFILLVCDEVKYVKKLALRTDTEQRKSLEMLNEYYVNADFSGDSSNFCLANRMVYQKFEAYLVQERGSETEDLALSCEPLDVGLDVDLIQDKYPLKSQSWLLFYGPSEADEYAEKEYEALLLPQYNQPKIMNISSSDIGNYKAEYFYYHDNNYIIYHFASYSEKEMGIEVYNRNGVIHQKLKLKLELDVDPSSYKIYISPSGRYMLSVENEPRKPEDDPYGPRKSIGKIHELYMDYRTKKFTLETKKTIPDFKEQYGQGAEDINTYYNYAGYKFFLTDNMEILITCTEGDGKILYEGVDHIDEVKNKMGKSEVDKDQYKKLIDFNIEMKNGGFCFYNEEEVYFLRINSNLKTIMPLIKINFRLNKAQMTVNKICACPDPSLIVIGLYKGSDNLLIVWDIEDNREVYNFSTSESWYYIYGPGSKAGFILNGDTYVNLDKGLINYFFEYQFSGTSIYEQTSGYRINKDEDMILEYGNFITKETLIEVSALDDLIQEVSEISEDNINLERIRFQVDGNTSLHMYALEYDTLSLILDYMEDHRPEYLTGILMKNNKDKSPLDITLDNESPKNTELLLRKLSLFHDSSLSILFYDRFSELLSMNITAFHEYLDSCFFQTVQMKNIKYLKLKKDKDPWLVPHSSCLIDEVFVEKYCRSDERKKLEAEKKKKDEEDRIKKEQDEENKKNEENKGPGGEETKGADGLNKNSVMDKDSDQDLLEVEEFETKKKVMTKEEIEAEKERRKQKRLDIRAIEFDWIFNKKEGAGFMKTLAETDCIELFSLTVVRHIIKFTWSYFRRFIVIYLLLPYLFYFSLFVIYVTYFHKKKVENEDGDWEGFGLANSISIIILLIMSVYFALYEAQQIFFHRLQYFISFWNLLDLSSLVLNVIILISDFASMNEADLVSLSACAAILMWLKLFYFGRIFFSTAAMIRMVLEITYDMRYFLLVMLIAICGFGNCFMIIARNYDPSEMFTGNSYWKSFLYSYNQAMGNFDTDAFEDDDKYLLYCIWFLNTMITLIIFLNLLIAIMGDTFGRVQETTENNMLKELANIMVENELLMNRKTVFGDAKYIIIIQEEKAEESLVSWEGGLKYIRKFMDRSVVSQNQLLKTLEIKIGEKIKERAEKKAKEIENSANKYFSSIFEKADRIEARLKLEDEVEE